MSDKQTTGKHWRSGYPIQFPSGNWARLRSISVTMLLTVKTIPNEMMTLVEEYIQGPRSVEITPDDIIRKVGGQVDNLRIGRQFYEAYAYAAFVEPRVVENPTGDDEIAPIDISDDDLAFAYEFLGRPAAELARFSAECIRRTNENLEPVLNVKEFFGETLDIVGGEPVLQSVDGFPGGSADRVEI